MENVIARIVNHIEDNLKSYKSYSPESTSLDAQEIFNRYVSIEETVTQNKYDLIFKSPAYDELSSTERDKIKAVFENKI